MKNHKIAIFLSSITVLVMLLTPIADTQAFNIGNQPGGGTSPPAAPPPQTAQDVMNILNTIPGMPAMFAQISGVSQIQSVSALMSALGNVPGVGALLAKAPNLGSVLDKITVPNFDQYISKIPGLEFIGKLIGKLGPLISRAGQVISYARLLTNPGAQPFGGTITKKKHHVCLIYVGQAGPVPIIIPIPFIYLEVSLPTPAKLYYLYGGAIIPLFSKLHREYRLEETAKALGNHWPFMDDVFRQICNFNKQIGYNLPEADGVIHQVGTSCKANEGISCRKNGIANSPALPGFTPTNFPQAFNGFCDPNNSSACGISSSFDPTQFPNICDPASLPGQCL